MRVKAEKKSTFAAVLIFEDDIRHMSLSEANYMVREVVETALPDAVWVQAELMDIRERGHCYMELVEKDDSGHTPIAQARACCWSNTWHEVKGKWEQVMGDAIMERGMKMLFLLKANFHEAYGFSWTVLDIDPTYTIGEMAKNRKEIIRKLKEAGVYDMQRELPVSPFAKRIAIISSPSAAGYEDFCRQLEGNDYGFAFEKTLFPATMQGENIEDSIIAALNAINEELEKYDVVVIIRGGGSGADLSGFDTLALAENVANFPLPIITGIGHDRDETVIDAIACVSLKTPTAVAAYLIDNLAMTLERLDSSAQRITRAVERRLETEKIKIEGLGKQLTSSVAMYFLKQKHALQMIEQRVGAADPINILRRGYTMAIHNGKAVKDATLLKKGDRLTLIAAKGEREVEVCG